MEPKFKEQVNRNPNQDLSNTPMNEGPAEEKIKTIAAGPLYAAGKAGVYNKIGEALKKFYSAFKNFNGKIMISPSAGFPGSGLKSSKNGGRII